MTERPALPIEDIAKDIHAGYVATFADPTTAPRWEDLSDDEREQSRSQAGDIEHKLALINRRLAVPGQPLEFSEREIELLARVEHDRWTMVELGRGYTHGHERRDDEPKTHPDLVPWEELDADAWEKDRAVVRAIPELLKAAQFGVETRPLVVRLGVVGHERLANQTQLVNRLREVTSRIINSVACHLGPDHRGVRFSLVITGWGEATQLREFVRTEPATFGDADVVRVRPVLAPPSSDSREPAGTTEVEDERSLDVAAGVYRDAEDEHWSRLAEEVADRSDIVMVVSARNGMFGGSRDDVPFGATEIAKYSRDRRFPTYVFLPKTGRISLRPRTKADFERYLAAAAKTPTPPSTDPDDEFTYESPALRRYANQVDAYFQPFIDRADAVAIHRKRVYYAAGGVVLAAAALALAAFGARVILSGDPHWLRYVESAGLAIALGVTLVSRFLGWNRQWLTFRGLAERLRSAKYLALARHKRPTHAAARRVTGTEPWVAAEAWLIWDGWADQAVDRNAVPTLDVVRHLRDHWIVAQLKHHRARVRVCERHERRLKRVIFVAAFATLALVTLGALGTFDTFHASAFEFAAFSIPVLAGVYAGIGEQREWRHYVARSRRTARELEQLAADLDDLDREPDDDRLGDELHAIALRVDKALRHDLKDWFWSMELSEIHAD